MESCLFSYPAYGRGLVVFCHLVVGSMQAAASSVPTKCDDCERVGGTRKRGAMAVA